MTIDRHSVVTVAMEDFSQVPFSVTVTLKRPLCRCWLGLTRSHRVASYVFVDGDRGTNTYTTLSSPVNTLLMERYIDQQAALVKITVRGRGKEKVKVLIDLETFLQELSTVGFVQVGRQLILRLLQTESEELQTEEQDHLEEDLAPSLDPNNPPYRITNNVQVSFHPPSSLEDSRRPFLSSSVNTVSEQREKNKKRRKNQRRKKNRSRNSTADPAWLPRHIQDSLKHTDDKSLAY